jgi:hypothetical protein
MVAAALVEAKRVSIAKENNLMDNPQATVTVNLYLFQSLNQKKCLI